MSSKKFKMATENDLDFIFRRMSELKDIFSHIRKDYLQRMIEDNLVIFEKGVVIVFQKYVKAVRLGTVLVPKGSYMLHQLINTSPKSGYAHQVIDKFCSGRTVFLNVKADNHQAIKFYKRNRFRKIGDIAWKNNTIKGLVMCRRVTVNDLIRSKRHGSGLPRRRQKQKY